MNKVFIIILCLISVGTGVFLFPQGPSAVLIGISLAGLALIVISNQEDKDFLLRIFLTALILRFSVAIIINVFDLHEFFGPDSITYDYYGNALSQYWWGELPGYYYDVIKARDSAESGWGMYYLVAGVYFITGRNLLALQFFCAALGAATVVTTYLCALEIFSNKRSARITAIIIALCPSLILWSSQGLKDGIIVFFLVLAVLNVIRLQKKFDYLSFVLLMTSLFSVLALRFYIFYMLVGAIIGCFAIGNPLNPISVLRRTLLLLVIFLSMSSFGNRGGSDLSQFNLNKVNQTREDLARGNAGYGKDIDVSTTGGAILALPTGLLYLMLAPFPWQLGNLRQAITFPEMLLWWASMPFLISGLIYTIKHRLRNAIAVLLFTLMLTMAYSLYQGNVGTAYRQRAQIQIFHFMFIAVGWTLWKEKKENKAALKNIRRNMALKAMSQQRTA